MNNSVFYAICCIHLHVTTHSTDTPAFELLASGKASGTNLVLRGFASPRRVFTLDNVRISDFFVFSLAGLTRKVRLQEINCKDTIKYSN